MIFRKFGRSQVRTRRGCAAPDSGLTFCKLVVDLHGGMIWVNSKEGEGKRVLRAASRCRHRAHEEDAARAFAIGAHRSEVMKVFLRTFGCRANHYDTEAVRRMLAAGRRRGESTTRRTPMSPCSTAAR